MAQVDTAHLVTTQPPNGTDFEPCWPVLQKYFGEVRPAAMMISAGLLLDAGIIPTPAAAFLIADIKADFGVVISASHNAAPDNGIKFFAAGGKTPDGDT